MTPVAVMECCRGYNVLDMTAATDLRCADNDHDGDGRSRGESSQGYTQGSKDEHVQSQMEVQAAGGWVSWTE